jgi:hypothetical protein
MRMILQILKNHTLNQRRQSGECHRKESEAEIEEEAMKEGEIKRTLTASGDHISA